MDSAWMVIWCFGVVVWFMMRKWLVGSILWALVLVAMSPALSSGQTVTINYRGGSAFGGGTVGAIEYVAAVWGGSSATWGPSGSFPAGSMSFTVANFGGYWQGSGIQGKIGTTQTRRITVRLHLPEYNTPYVEGFVDGQSVGVMYPENEGQHTAASRYGTAEGTQPGGASMKGSGVLYATNENYFISSGGGYLQFGGLDFNAHVLPTTQPDPSSTQPTTQGAGNTWMTDMRDRISGGSGLLPGAKAAAEALPAEQSEQSIFGDRFEPGWFDAADDAEEAAAAVVSFVNSISPGLTGEDLSEHVGEGFQLESVGQFLTETILAYDDFLEDFSDFIVFTQTFGTLIVCWLTAQVVFYRIAWGTSMRDPEGVLPPSLLGGA